MPREAKDLSVVTRTYDFIVWMMDRVDKFPRNYRFLLGDRLLGGLLDVLEFLIQARYSPKERLPLLQKVNFSLQKLRYLLRLAKDKQLMSLKSYEFGAKSMDELGREVGGWAQSLKERR